MNSNNCNKAYFEEILARQTLNAANLPKTSISSVNTYEELDRYYEEVMAQESESRSQNKLHNRTPFYLKANFDEIEIPRRDPPQSSVVQLHSNFNETSEIKDRMESEVEPYFPARQIHMQWLQRGAGTPAVTQSTIFANNSAIARQTEPCESRVTNAAGRRTPPTMESEQFKQKSPGMTVGRRIKMPDEPKPQNKTKPKKRQPDEVFVGKAYQYVAARRLSRDRQEGKRASIPPTRYWCDRPVYKKGVLQGVIMRQL